MRLYNVLFFAFLSGCATRPDAVVKGNPLDGLLPANHAMTESPVRLADLPLDSGVVIIPSKGSQKALDYFKAFDESVRGGTPDIFGFLGKNKASEDPRHSVLLITQALRNCFGNVQVARDFPDANRMPSPLVAVVDLAVAYPLWGAWTADYDVVFLDKQGRSVHRIQAQGSKVPMPFQYEEGLVVQRRAAEDLSTKLRAARLGKCAA